MAARSKPRHIVIDARRLGDYGIGTYIRNLIGGLARVDPHSRYTLVVPPDLPPATLSLGPNFQTAPYPTSDAGFLHHLAFPRFLRRFNADLFHIPLNSVAYWMPSPYVLTIHDMSTLLYPSGGDIRGTLHEERYRRGAARAARIIAVSDSTRQDIEAVLRIDPSRIQTIYSAPDPAYAADGPDLSQTQKILDRYSIRPPYVLFAGAIRPQKNVPRLVEAFSVVRQELENNLAFQDLKLVIIGDELSKSQAVRRAVIAARLEAHVRFLGFVPVETLKVFYRAASVFAFPSLYEGFGLAPLEAMLCGTPVVTSGLPALEEAVGEAAELVTPDNVFDIARGLRQVLCDRERSDFLRQAGFRQVKRFDWDVTARAVSDIYGSISQNNRMT